MITRPNRTTSHRPPYHPDGAFTFFQVSSNRGITLRLHLLHLHAPQPLSFLIAREVSAMLVAGKVSFHASFSGIRERIRTLNPGSGGHLSLSTHGTCLAMLSARYLPLLAPATPCLLSHQLPSIFRAHLDSSNPCCHMVCAVKAHAHAPSISPC
jgi:hypothetical protein